MAFKRKHYLVKPKLQLKYLVLLALIMLISAILIYYSFLNSLLSSPGMDQLSAGAVKNFVRSYNSGFFWAMLIFAIIVLFESIFYFHRLIGPIFFFEKVMKQLAEGNFSMIVHHRKKIDSIKVAIDSGKTDEAKHMLCELTQWFKTEQK